MTEITMEDIRRSALGELSPFTAQEQAELASLNDDQQFWKRFQELLEPYLPKKEDLEN